MANDDVGSALTGHDAWNDFRRSPNIEDRRDDGPLMWALRNFMSTYQNSPSLVDMKRMWNRPTTTLQQMQIEDTENNPLGVLLGMNDIKRR